MNRVFIVGAIGFDNMAEECLLLQMIHKIRQDEPGIHIGVLSNAPAKTAKLGVEAVPRADMRAMWEAVEDSHAVVWLRSESALDWRTVGLEMLLLRLARWRKKRTYGCRSEHASLQGGWIGQQTEKVFNRCGEKHLFRIDEGEGAAGEHIGQPHPLLAVRRSQVEGLRHLQDEGIHLSNRPVVFCLDRTTAMGQVDRIAAVADKLIGQGAQLLFMPVDHFADMEAANQVLERMTHAAPVIRKTYSAQEWIDILGDTFTVLTSYESVRAMCRGLDVPCVDLNAKALASMSEEDVLEEVVSVSSQVPNNRQR